MVLSVRLPKKVKGKFKFLSGPPPLITTQAGCKNLATKTEIQRFFLHKIEKITTKKGNETEAI
jgi:hypothetical protein